MLCDGQRCKGDVGECDGFLLPLREKVRPYRRSFHP